VFVGVGEVDSSQTRSHEQIEMLESRMASMNGPSIADILPSQTRTVMA